MASPELASTDVSGVVTAPQPIVVERAMYLNRPGQPFAAGHGSAGVTTPATSWFLAEGATGPFFELFVLIANPTLQAAAVRVDYLLPGGGTLSKQYTVRPESRFTIWVDDEQLPAGSGQRPLASTAVAMRVTSTNAVPIVVERSMWWPQPLWYEAHNAAGTTVTGTRWALAEGFVGGPKQTETYVLVANTAATAGVARVSLYFEYRRRPHAHRAAAGREPHQHRREQPVSRGGRKALQYAGRERGRRTRADCGRARDLREPRRRDVGGRDGRGRNPADAIAPGGVSGTRW